MASNNLTDLNNDLSDIGILNFEFPDIVVTAGSHRFTLDVPSNAIHKKVKNIIFYGRFDNVYYSWCPQLSSSPYMDEENCWNVNINNLRGSDVTIYDLSCTVFYIKTT